MVKKTKGGGSGPQNRVLEEVVLKAPGFRVSADKDFSVQWDSASKLMTRFHGYPYTSVGSVIVKT